MVKYAEQHDNHPTTALLSRHISLPSKCLSILKACYSIQQSLTLFSLCMYFFLSWFMICAVTVWTENNIFVCSAQSVTGEAISYLVTLYESSVCQRQESTHIWVQSHLNIIWHSCPHIPLRHGCQMPTDGKSAFAQHASTMHINKYTSTERHASRQKLEAHTHADTPKGK